MRLDSNTLFRRDISTYCKEMRMQKKKGDLSEFRNRRMRTSRDINRWVERIIARVEWREEQSKWDL